MNAVKIRVVGITALLGLCLIVLVILASIYLAVRIILWLLPVIIVVAAALVLLYLFNKPRRRKNWIDADFRVK